MKVWPRYIAPDTFEAFEKSLEDYQKLINRTETQLKTGKPEKKMRVTDQNHLNQKRLPNGRFAPKNPSQNVASPGPINPTVVNPPLPVTKLVAGIVGPVPAPEPLVNHVAIVIDRSSSMAGLMGTVRTELNNLLDSIRKNANLTGQPTTVSLYSFANEVTPLYFGVPINSVRNEANNLTAWGSTALFDGVGDAIEALTAREDSSKQNVSFLVMVLTDGEENVSRRHNAATFSRLLNTVQGTNRWTVSFLLPPGKKASFCRSFGVPEGNCREWEATTQGLQIASHTTQQGVTHYYQTRSLGGSSTKSFYTDLANVTPTQLQNNLQDIQDKVKVLTVEKETEIRPFVEEKTGKPYSLGTAFYQLTKPEKVQAGKQILVKEKTGSAVYGGYDARTVLGIPQGQDLRITPGNHANFDVFVQSTSTNRKLVRGTKLIVMK